MAFVGFHASHEQIPPSRLLRDIEQAEAAGFDGAMCSDHFSPWLPEQGHSGFAWSWLGAALARTSFPIGVVNAPGQRYHPAIIAQAVATLEEMFPGRFWAALGSGEAINEHITGAPWPEKSVRNQRLAESVDVIRRLLAGEEVSHDGLVTVDRARLWTRPGSPPPLLAAAVSARTAAWAAGWADGLATVAADPASLRQVIEAYRGAGGSGPIVLQVHVSWAPTDAEAMGYVRSQWRNALIGAPLAWDIDQPEDVAALSEDADDGRLREAVFVSSDAEELTGRIAELVSIGFDRVYLHHVGQSNDAFLAAAASDILPRLRDKL
jgi:probable non-F420 flavinoid oxidoreductase